MFPGTLPLVKEERDETKCWNVHVHTHKTINDIKNADISLREYHCNVHAVDEMPQAWCLWYVYVFVLFMFHVNTW